MIPFIYSKHNVFSKETCEQIINTFEQSNLKKEVDSRLGDGSIHKKSTDIYFEDGSDSEWMVKEENLWYSLLYNLNDVLNQNLSNYYTQYPELNQMPPVECIRFNMQKYNPGEGFAGWHFENSYGTGKRTLVWMIYLNNVEDGGTEFKYQNHLEQAEQGKLLIWPGDWIFTHRGQISNTKIKYILTGWFESII